MHKIYTCKYFASWSKHTHVSKSIFNLRSHANSVHISILKGTRTCCTAGMYKLLMAAAILFVLMIGRRMLLNRHLFMINGTE